MQYLKLLRRRRCPASIILLPLPKAFTAFRGSRLLIQYPTFPHGPNIHRKQGFQAVQKTTVPGDLAKQYTTRPMPMTRENPPAAILELRSCWRWRLLSS